MITKAKCLALVGIFVAVLGLRLVALPVRASAMPIVGAGASTAITTFAADNDIKVQCETSWNPLSWFMCPLIFLFQEAVNLFDKQINDMLDIKTNDYFGSSTKAGQGFKQVWSNMRTISLAILVIAGLIMIISTAIGIGVFDAYTVKKIFPRLMIAIIGISISWPLVIFIIEASNALGLGVRGIIQAPFKDAFDSAVKLGGGQQTLGVAAIGIAGMAFGTIGLLSMVATAFLAALLAFLVLVLRQIVVIFLAIMAPVAIAAYVLPNTQKYSKLWWETFSKTLLAFPIISGFIAIGRVFSVVTVNISGGDTNAGTLRGLIAFIAYFAPYFIIPKAFSMAGGALGNLSGMVNDRSKGAFDRLSNFRGNRAKDRVKRFRSGGVYDKSTRRGRFGNAVGGYLFDGDEKIPYKLGKAGVPGFQRTATRMGSEIEHTALEQTQKLSQELQGMGFNAEALAAVAGSYGSLSAGTRARILAAQRDGTLSKGSPRSMADFQALSHILAQSESETERIGGNAIEGSAGRLGSLNRDAEMGYANIAGAAMFERSRQGFASGEEIAGLANNIEAEHGTGMAQAIATRAQLLGQAQRPDLKAGYGVLYKEGEGFSSGVTGNKRVDVQTGAGTGASLETAGRATERSVALIKTLKQQDIMGAKAQMVKQLGTGFQALATETDADGQLTPEARAIRDTITQNISVYAGNDVGAKVEWRKIAESIDPTIIRTAEAQDAQRAAMEAVGGGGGGGGGGTPGSVGPPTPTPPGGAGFGT